MKGRTRPMAAHGIKVHEVEKGSLAEQAGLAPGDEILSVNQHQIPDELALKSWSRYGSAKRMARKRCWIWTCRTGPDSASG